MNTETTNTPFQIMGDKTASVRSEKARAKFGPMLEQGKLNAVKAVTDLQTNVPSDYIVPAQRLTFSAEQGEGETIKAHIPRKLGEPEIITDLHRHAFGQVMDKSGIGSRYGNKLMEWGRADLLAHNLNELFHDTEVTRPDTRFLMRSVGGQVRGFLSDRYRRMDSAPIVESFIKGFQAHGAVPIEARNLDTKFFMKVALAEMFEPVPGEVILYGLSFGNSDFGDGAITLRDWILRLICANGMTGEEGFRKIHLGARLGEDLLLSQNTHDLDTKTVSSAVGDIVGNLLQPATVKARIEGIKKAASEEINADRYLNSLRKKSKLTKDEAEKVAELYRSTEIEMLPQGNSSWRLSNAISLLAHDVAPERTLELEQVAGEVVDTALAA